jgi:hypothetical protein
MNEPAAKQKKISFGLEAEREPCLSAIGMARQFHIEEALVSRAL